jgi:hypothetical protein
VKEGSAKEPVLCKHDHIHTVGETKYGGSVKRLALCKYGHIQTVGEAKGGGRISEKVNTMQVRVHTPCKGGQIG